MKNSETKTLGRRVRETAELGWAVAREAGASLLTYELYPLGLVGETIPKVPTLWIKKQPDKLPVLFIHGIFHNRSAFAWLGQRLAWEGWQDFHEINLFTSIHSVPKMAQQVGTEVDRILKKHNVPQIDIVAHSMGGIVARYFVQLLSGDGKIRHLITLGTPHQGTKLSRYSVLPHIKELFPQSALLTKLNGCPPPSITQGLAISGTLDLFMQPRAAVWWEGVRNIELKNVGHAGLLFSRRVAQIVVSRLGEMATAPRPSYSQGLVPADL